MRVLSNAFLSQVEITQVDRWNHGPLEIHLVPEPQESGHSKFGGLVYEWNSGQCGGFLRDAETLDSLGSIGLHPGKNPNIVIAPTHCGYSELLGMLGSLLPDDLLASYGIDRPESNFWLWPLVESNKIRSLENLELYSSGQLNQISDEHLIKLASVVPIAFEKWIWTRLTRSKRFGLRDFARDSSLRMLAGDIRFWMHRLYRIAIELYESSPVVEQDDESWHSLDEISLKMNSVIPKHQRKNFKVSRPRMGGQLWQSDDPSEREWVTDLLVRGDTTFQSLEPIVDVLMGSAAHEDFSDRYSWIKEDFERAFYSKRSRVKVRMFEFIDNCAVHQGVETPGYEDILFRDVMAFFDARDRTIILALRQGKTQSEIAEQLGHSGHASICRRVKAIEFKMQEILRNE